MSSENFKLDDISFFFLIVVFQYKVSDYLYGLKCWFFCQFFLKNK